VISGLATLALLVGALASGTAPAAALQTPAPETRAAAAGAQVPRPAPDPPFRVGEALTYSIAYAFVDAGTLRMSVEGIENVNGRPAYHFVSRAQTNSSISALYSLTDHLQSWMDVERLYSLRYHRDAVEKGKKRSKHLTFDQARHVKIFEHDGSEKAIAPEAQDDVSILYYLRTLPFAEGKTFTLDNLADPEDNPMRIAVLGTEKVRVAAGTFDCWVLKLDVHTDSGVFSQGGEVKTWLSRDPRHVLVKLQSKLSVGSFNVELTEFQPGADGPPAASGAAPAESASAAGPAPTADSAALSTPGSPPASDGANRAPSSAASSTGR
jgi:hypothetical protein